MGESFLMSEDEPLTSNIDGVMALWVFRRRAQNTKIGRKLLKMGPLESSFHLICPGPLVRCVPELVFPELRNRPRWGEACLVCSRGIRKCQCYPEPKLSWLGPNKGFKTLKYHILNNIWFKSFSETLFSFLKNIEKLPNLAKIVQNRTNIAYLALETELVVN